METMKNKLILYASMLLFVTVGFSPLVLIDKINITFPVAEQAVQGKVEILGEIDIDDFISYQLLFSPEGTSNQTWFPIASGNQQGKKISLGIWDTNLLSDGQYTLRLIIEIENIPSIDKITTGIRVRNYTSFSTNTPTPFPTGPNTQTPTPTTIPNTPTTIPPTDFPPNPAELTYDSLEQTLIYTVGVVFLLFIFLLVYRRFQN
jgi:hypothetical protein